MPSICCQSEVCCSAVSIEGESRKYCTEYYLFPRSIHDSSEFHRRSYAIEQANSKPCTAATLPLYEYGVHRAQLKNGTPTSIRRAEKGGKLQYALYGLWNENLKVFAPIGTTSGAH